MKLKWLVFVIFIMFALAQPISATKHYPPPPHPPPPSPPHHHYHPRPGPIIVPPSPPSYYGGGDYGSYYGSCYYGVCQGYPQQVVTTSTQSVTFVVTSTQTSTVTQISSTTIMQTVTVTEKVRDYDLLTIAFIAAIILLAIQACVVAFVLLKREKSSNANM